MGAIQTHNEWFGLVAASDVDLRIKGATTKVRTLFPFKQEKEVRNTLSLVQEAKDVITQYWAAPRDVAGCSAKHCGLYKLDPQDEVEFFTPRGPSRAFAMVVNSKAGGVGMDRSKLPPSSASGRLAQRAQEASRAANLQLRAAYLQAQSLKTMTENFPAVLAQIEPLSAELHETLRGVKLGLDYSHRVAEDMFDMAARASARATHELRQAWLHSSRLPPNQQIALLRMPILPGSVEAGEAKAYLFGEAFTSELAKSAEVRKQLQELKVPLGGPAKNPANYKGKGYKIPKKKSKGFSAPAQRSVLVQPLSGLTVTRNYGPRRGGARGRGGRGSYRGARGYKPTRGAKPRV
jgi:hypothetical protein